MTRHRPRLDPPRASTESGTLFVVATPIGNLEDITLRALRILREVDLVAAEDTRRTGNLLRHYEISTPLLSVHEHNERDRVSQILERLRRGESVALVSDAGTPGISDPGAEIVRAVRDAGFPAIPVPGPSTLAATMSVSGTAEGPVSYFGFVPHRSKDRIRWIEQIAQLPAHTIVCFEAPHRVRRTLADLRLILVDRPILVGREITKLHEEWREGTAAELAEHFQEPKGEFVLLVRPQADPSASHVPPSDDEIAVLFGQLTETNAGGRRQALRSVAERLGIPVRTAYEAIERVKNKVNDQLDR